MGVCDSKPDEDEDLPESHKTGDGAAAVARLEQEEARGMRERSNSEALAQSTARTISVVVGLNDPDLMPNVRGKCIVWTTEVNDTTTVEKVMNDWYMCKTSAAANLDPLGDVGPLQSLVPQWPLLEDGHPVHTYSDSDKFGKIFKAHGAPVEGLIRMVGVLKSGSEQDPDPNMSIMRWYEGSLSKFWVDKEQWLDLHRVIKGRSVAE
eukprot:TRINITY_DN13829_c0_g1_i1.p1 TRINITY_DN13829_c0_g1~~TRINITY_DN13829_c0_g1_i1.p1  ORF type:complete len:207 (-),score=33.66 TRINITY_DN13829_c0_g1_i1:189-809(-)